MRKAKYITILSGKRKIVLNEEDILYILMVGKAAEFHMTGGVIHRTRTAMNEIEAMLGDSFIKIHRGCIVSVMAIHNITDKVNLNNGESLIYTVRKKKQIIDQLINKQELMIQSFKKNGEPMTKEEFHDYYRVFDTMPFAFTDIEMVFDESRHAVDWIFRYANPALARLEKLPLERLIGSSFSSLFSNMDSKWLPTYERATLYRELLEIIDYSPEIDTQLQIICFPTFEGHCGCILLDAAKLSPIQQGNTAQQIIAAYLSHL